MRRIFQKNWFGIDFNDVSELSQFKVADSEFYRKFYKIFYTKFKSYSALPKEWRDGKDQVAEHLYSIVKDKEQILSIGCGTGYIEDKLIHSFRIRGNITAIDPGITQMKWIDSEAIEVYNGFFPDILTEKKVFDVVYAASIDYVFNDKEYTSFLKSVYNYGVKDFILTIIFIPDESLLGILKDFFKSLMSLFKLYDKGQLWGYLRTIDEHKIFIGNVGFNDIEVGNYNKNTYWIRARND